MSRTSRTEQRRLVEAFFVATRTGDLTALADVLDPDAVLRIDAGPVPASLARHGADAVAAQTVRGLASALRQPSLSLDAVLVNGRAGVVARSEGRAMSVIGFSFADGRIRAIEAIADPKRVDRLLASIVG